MISTRIFSPSLLPPLLLQVRALVFPDNTIGPPPPPPPSPEEARLIRSKAASDLLSLFPNALGRKFFAVVSSSNKTDSGDGGGVGVTAEDEEMRLEVEERVLGWTDNAEMNKYLVYAILEYVVVRLIPEMVDQTPSELLAERGVSLTDGDISDIIEVQLNGAEKRSSA
ncbi:hypothetical protein A1O1_01040 [Capronia coronata CBS 617.96]|uniref:Uncharacterized protein n=1 Tax=Capronia coronata CBS 617.96 TaxID=1182541 RepID=W9Z1V5_9EURO|nr:uncharacterized protein A1O1_01040 [Capronia coronata CBS 617.96]EXJ95915.1 hypothetical protein A1O1_01040 [Capronia coronata CBS 617.96]